MECRERGAHVVDELQRLRHDRAVERIRPGSAAASVRSATIVASGLPSSAMRMSTARHAVTRTGACSPVPRSRARGRGCRRVCADEALDVDAIDRRPALEAPVRVDGRDPAKITEVERPAIGASRRRRRRRGRSRLRAAAGTNLRQPAARTVLFAGCQGRDDSAVSRIVVLSPHSDDGVLSLGASMARWARSGRQVELVTVLALDPSSTAETGGWDRRAGFLTEGRRCLRPSREDRAACTILGVTPQLAAVRECRLRPARRRRRRLERVPQSPRRCRDRAPSGVAAHASGSRVAACARRRATACAEGRSLRGAAVHAQGERIAVRTHGRRRARPAGEVARRQRLPLAAPAPRAGRRTESTPPRPGPTSGSSGPRTSSTCLSRLHRP